MVRVEDRTLIKHFFNPLTQHNLSEVASTSHLTKNNNSNFPTRLILTLIRDIIYSTPLTACQSATLAFNDQITKFDDVISVCVRGNIVCRNERDVIGKFDRTKTFYHKFSNTSTQ